MQVGEGLLAGGADDHVVLHRVAELVGGDEDGGKAPGLLLLLADGVDVARERPRQLEALQLAVGRVHLVDQRLGLGRHLGGLRRGGGLVRFSIRLLRVAFRGGIRLGAGPLGGGRLFLRLVREHPRRRDQHGYHEGRRDDEKQQRTDAVGEAHHAILQIRP